MREGEPLLREQLRPLVRELQPLTRDLSPSLRDLDAVTPSLTSAFKVLRYLGNESAYNPPGKDEGNLFWLAWFFHNLNSGMSTEDAHGSTYRGFAMIDCSLITKQNGVAQLLAFVPLPVSQC